MLPITKKIECLCDWVMVLKCLNEKVTRGPRRLQNTANPPYYFYAGASSSESSGCRGVSLTLNKTEGYERRVYETTSLNANRLLTKRLHPATLWTLHSAPVKSAKKKTTNNQKKINLPTPQKRLWKLHRKWHLRPRAESQTRRHLARNVMSISLAVGGGDSRRDLEWRGNIKRE